LWLIVGLGNPGRRYSKTRHNIGFLVLEELAERLGLSFRDLADYRICSGSIEDERIILLEPLTFMNRSGSAVVRVAKKFAVAPERTVVVHDDLDMETGRLKIRRNGSSGGHRGVQSVIEQMGTRDFGRVKIGIGRAAEVPTEEYVLSKFGKADAAAVAVAVRQAADALLLIVEQGVDKAMNTFN
jgi:PTH1 family peptidyl-tRNA hydrolase